MNQDDHLASLQATTDQMTYQILEICVYTVAFIASLNYLVLLYMYVHQLSESSNTKDVDEPDYYGTGTMRRRRQGAEKVISNPIELTQTTTTNRDRLQQLSHSPSNSEHYQSPHSLNSQQQYVQEPIYNQSTSAASRSLYSYPESGTRYQRWQQPEPWYYNTGRNRNSYNPAMGYDTYNSGRWGPRSVACSAPSVTVDRRFQNVNSGFYKPREERKLPFASPQNTSGIQGSSGSNNVNRGPQDPSSEPLLNY